MGQSYSSITKSLIDQAVDHYTQLGYFVMSMEKLDKGCITIEMSKGKVRATYDIPYKTFYSIDAATDIVSIFAKLEADIIKFETEGVSTNE